MASLSCSHSVSSYGKLPFMLRIDASGYGLGAVLVGIVDNTPSLLSGMNKFNYYLLGKEFIVGTDCKPLIY